MDNQFYHPGNTDGFNYDKKKLSEWEATTTDLNMKNTGKRDEDLIIEDNTIYEVDRDCFERLKKQKKKK
ncbi:MAG TPA: hypothetical protein VJZ06_05620 [Mobilitalea sp.]|nr:hypothetical protein [Mobilitalea sp.]